MELAEWLGFEDEGCCARVREEVRGKTLRYDLVLEFDCGGKRNVELKLHADFTQEQHADLSNQEPGAIHAIVVPEYRLDEVHKRYDKDGLIVRTWEDFAKGPARDTPRAVVLFDQLLEYVHGVEVLTVEQVKNAVRLWGRGEWSGDNDYGLLHRFLVRLRDATRHRYPSFEVGRVWPAPKSWFYGFLIRPEGMEDAIWFGLAVVPTEDWREFYLQVEGEAQSVLCLPRAGDEDRWWQVNIPTMEPNVERFPADGDGRYTLKSFMRNLWRHLDRLK